MSSAPRQDKVGDKTPPKENIWVNLNSANTKTTHVVMLEIIIILQEELQNLKYDTMKAFEEQCEIKSILIQNLTKTKSTMQHALTFGNGVKRESEEKGSQSKEPTTKTSPEENDKETNNKEVISYGSDNGSTLKEPSKKKQK